MNICKKFRLISNEVVNLCDSNNIIEQINIINISIFQDNSIDHIERLKRQSELFEFSENRKINFSSAYILNLISQTNIQLGNFSSALDSSIKAKSKWEKERKDKLGMSGLILCYSDIKANLYENGTY